MVTARQIVSLLLEKGEAAHPGGASGVWIFGPGIPADGYAYGSLGHLLLSFQRLGRTRTPGAQALNHLIQTDHTIIHKKSPRDIVVYSRILPRPMPEQAMNVVGAYLALPGDVPMVHKAHWDDAGEKRVTASQIFYPQKQTEPKAQMESASAGSVGGAGSLGFTYDAVYERNAVTEEEKGCLVAAAHPGGPVAQSGIQAGDVIQAITCTEKGGQQQEFRIRGHEALARALALADAAQPVLFYVRRGHEHLNVVVEVKAAAVPAQPQAGARQRPTTRRLLPAKGVPAQPNEPLPAAQTGIEPPNVSTLT